MKAAGIILLIIGGIGLIISGINYANQTDKFSLLGLDITVSEGNIAPLIITGVVFLVGLVLTVSKKK